MLDDIAGAAPQPTQRRIPWWFLFPLLTFGTATFALVGYGGWRLRSRGHVAAAAGYFLLLTGFVAGVQFTAPDVVGVIDAVLVPLFLVNWLVGSAHVGWLELQLQSRRFAAASNPAPDPALLTAQQRLARREQARTLLVDNPALAAELRIGRTDLGRRYEDGGLVDINNVPDVIAKELELPSIVAEQIVAQRTRVGGFHSADDLLVTATRSTRIR
jgi:hypothetical protein